MRSAAALALLWSMAASAPAPAAPDAAGWMGVAGATAELVDEPVFDRNVMLYRAGPREGEAVVLVHGLGPNGARDWAKVVPALAQRYEVFALDLPGFGRSDKGNELYSPDNFARVIEKALAPKIGRPFALIGHSLGAAVSLAYAAAHPARVRRLILVDMAGVLHGSVYAQSLARLGFEQATGVPAEGPWFDSLLRTALARIEAVPVGREFVLRTPGLRQKVFRGDPGMIAAYALGEHDFSEALRNVTAPTLVIWGGDDKVAPLRTGQLAAATIPGARLQVLPGVGHAPQLEDPARFNRLVLDELAGRGVGLPLALPKAGTAAGRIESCADRTGARYTGDFQKLTLIRCRDARISDARIGELRVLESDLAIVNTEIRGGLYALRSTLQLTAGVVAGAPALALEDSEVDAAGTRFEGEGSIAANLGERPLSLRLSVAEVRRAGKSPRHVHDVVRLGAKASW
jgi:pimeloyl-ACP methyl ester carboxylesterase